MTNKPMHYPEVNSNPHFPTLEEKIIKKWKEEDTFKKSVKGDKDFIFYDGPPFANGLPHYGHLLTGFIKDIFARYQTTQGKKVERRFGWDCHGLPAEMGAEKELGISGRIAIEEYGIDKFNDYCKKSVLKYTKEWETYVTRQARWVDFENDYKTMDINFMESVLWAFKALYDKGLLYESQRVLPYSWACETPVSDFETRMDNSYREKSSKAITVTLKLKKVPQKLAGKSCRLVIWTTTPWTLPSNLAAAVGEDIDYSCVEKEGEHYIIASALLHKYEKELGNNVTLEIKGKELIGLEYEPLFKYFENHENAFRILAGSFVTTEDGTGIVHIAPGFGEDDQILCEQNNIKVVCPVDNGGKFTHPVEDFLGLQVFDANDPVIKALKEQGNWIKTEQYLHNYPHCWRTDTPLIYKAVPSWYLKVTAIRDKMVENNRQINWIPGHIKDGLFGKWIENARDWSISRNRFWGCPIPVWQSDDPKYPNIEVYGSIKELEEAFKVEVKDLHRPFIDTLTRPNPKDPTGKSMMRRVSDVLDCWFESGSMPFAQVHYPFENKQWFEENFPADFIVEYLAQTRGWFYTLTVLSTALFDRPAFLNCICHGVILGDGGQKLSKRLKNYVDPNEVFDTLGSDAMRWYMVSSTVMRGQEVVIDKDARGMKESLRAAIKPLWNAYNFFTLYANADNLRATFDLSSQNLMDKYILSKCFKSIELIQKAMDEYDTPSATKVVENLLEVVNNWYIRRSRERFWKSEHDQDKLDAYNTLYSILNLICRAVSSLLPLITEEIYLGLNDNRGSVHLESFPDQAMYKADEDLISDMERVRDACTAALHIRSESGIRVRQPLAKVTFIGVAANVISDELSHLILDEINVKAWNSVDKSKITDYATYKLQIKFPVLGKRIPKKVKDIISANKQGNWKFENSKLLIGGEELREDEFELKLEPKAEFAGRITALSSNDALVLLNLNITEELRLEGIARDIVRLIQQARKSANLEITERIKVSLISSDENITQAIKAWDQYIKEQTLCVEITSDKFAEEQVYEEEAELEGIEVSLKLARYYS
ncbi:isoleucyl-tRNA ligase [endosymbiont of Acanthamoeba sp. UWC8]|uniref:isoleucine--tRNA ligase n=1 Tax=endosymbiont of Acanthamoeba sp. UWC8 TaxID=86106 RepID=UPI0004D13D64|nr:isoleucine--tRNA ligase [endosymbiont of Acanthamoeba sp. UWC8]AIF81552.1 isoleucyl-tRNA ligase [endosymbiont of Acanthamoeba sp. UWC8]